MSGMGISQSTYILRVRAVAAVRRGVPIGEVAQAYGVDRSTIFRWTQREARAGDSGLVRRPGSGRPRILQYVPQISLKQMVLQGASAFGYETDLWTVRRLQETIRHTHGVTASRNAIWRRLREAGLTYQKPERQYFEIDEQARAQWLRDEVPRIRHTLEKHRGILYFQDEANVSLTALLAKTWAPCGQTPKLRVTGGRGGVAALSAISRRGHLLFRLHERRIASPQVIDFLGQMLMYHPRRHLVVVMDQAPPHVSLATRTYIESQRRLHVFYLPKYSPDWNPDEKVWNHLKHQELAAHQARTRSELHDLTQRKLEKMSQDPALMRGLFFRCCVADLFE
jgi:transposase